MDKKCTLIAAALMVAGVFSANAQSSTTVPEAQWKAGNYYYLKTGSSVLSLSGEKADSVIVKTLASDATKAAIDSALWQITNAGTTPAGPVYQFKNKKTQAVLSFAASSTAKPVITSGVNQLLRKQSNLGVGCSWDRLEFRFFCLFYEIYRRGS